MRKSIEEMLAEAEKHERTSADPAYFTGKILAFQKVLELLDKEKADEKVTRLRIRPEDVPDES